MFNHFGNELNRTRNTENPEIDNSIVLVSNTKQASAKMGITVMSALICILHKNAQGCKGDSSGDSTLERYTNCEIMIVPTTVMMAIWIFIGVKPKIFTLSTFGKLAPNLHIYEYANCPISAIASSEQETLKT